MYFDGGEASSNAQQSNSIELCTERKGFDLRELLDGMMLHNASSGFYAILAALRTASLV
jgi:hypothetical protein